MSKVFQQESKVIALGEESNDMYISLDMIFLTSEVNLNSIQYSEDFIYGIEAEKYKYIGLPLQCDITKLEKGEYDKLTHKYNKKNNTFGTVSIGSFVDFKTQKNGEILELVASARVWKRNQKTCLALEELYGSDEGLKFSYEVLVGKSSTENGITKVPKDDTNNPIGSCVVSTPAVPSSIATLLVAEAYESDFIINQTIEGGENKNMARSKDTFTVEEMFKNTKVALIAELDMNQIQRKIYKALKDFIEEDWYEYDVIDQSMTYVIVKKYCDGDYYKIDYSVGETDVVLSNMRSVTKKYDDIVIVNPCPNCDMSCPQCQECNQKEEDLMAGSCKKTVAELETEIANLNATIETNKIELASVSEKLTESNSKVEVLSASVIEKDKAISELEPMKVEHEKIMAEKIEVELASKKAVMKEKYSKLLDEKTLLEVEIAEALEKMDESVLKDKVVEIAMAAATKTVAPKVELTLASRITDNVSIGAESDSLRAKYSI